MMKNFTQFFYEIDRSRKHLQATVFLLFIFSLLGTQEVLGQCPTPANATDIVGATEVCSGETSVSYSTGAVNGATSYQWALSSGGTIVEGQGTTSITVNFGTTATVITPTLTVTPRNDCGDGTFQNGTAKTETITITPTVGTPSFTGEPDAERCQGAGTTTYTATATDATGYTWSISPTTAGSIDENGLVTWASTFSGDVTISVNARGCNGPSTATIHVVSVITEPANATDIVGATEVCSGETSVSYSTGAVNGATSYQWALSSGGTIVEGQGTTSITVNFGTTATVITPTLTVTPRNDCGDGTAKTETITITPTVGTPSFTGEPDAERCQGAGTTTYTATATDATGYTWSISPTTAGSIDENGLVTWASTFSGEATISVIARGCNGPSTATSHVVNVIPTVGTPVFSAGTSSTRCGYGETVVFSATATNATGITYSINVDASKATVDPNTGAVTFVEGFFGDLTITATAQGCNGPKTATHVVTSYTTPTANAGSDQVKCADVSGLTSFTLGGTSNVVTDVGNGTREWSVVSQDATITGVNITQASAHDLRPTVAITGYGNVIIRLTATRTNPLTCGPATDDVQLTVKPLPIVAAITGDGSVCVNATIQLSNTTTGGVWSSLHPTIATVSATGEVTGKSAGTATIQYRVTTDGCSTTVTKNVVVNSNPTVAAITFTTDAICVGSTTTFESTTRTGVWSSSNTAVATVAQQNRSNENRGVVTGVAGGTAIISYTVTGTNGCKTTVSKTIRVDPASVKGTASAVPATICYNDGTTINLTGHTGSVLRWQRSTTSDFSSGVTTVLNSENVTSISPSSLTATTYFRAVVKSGACDETFSLPATVTVRGNLSTTSISSNPGAVCFNTGSEITFTGFGGTRITYKRDDGANQTIDIPAGATSAKINTGNLTANTTYTLVSAAYLDAPNCNTSIVNKSVTVTVNPLPAVPEITNIKSTYLTGEPTVTLIGNPTPTTGSTFTITGVGSTSSTNLAGGSFTPCSFSPGNYVIRYTYKDANGCTNFVDYPITIKQSTYTVLNVADPFIICRGQSTKFTAVVYRDVKLIYPYTNDPFNVNLRNNTVYNEAYTAYYRALYNLPNWEPSNTERLYPERTLQPIPINPDQSLSIKEQLNVSGFVLNANNFTYQWWRNGSPQGPDIEVRTIAALSATDEIRVAVKPKTESSCVTWSGPLLSGGGVTNGIPSNYLFFSEPNYELTIPAGTAPINICQGDNSVTITFPKGNFKWTKTNATMYWKLRRNTIEYTLQTIDIPSDATPEQVDAFFQLTADEIKAGLEAQSPPVSPTELIDGDEVYIDYISDIDRVVRTKCNQKAVLNRSDIVKVTVNKLVVNATEVLQTVCINGSYTFAADTTGTTGTAPLTFKWFVNNVEQTSATGSSFVLGTPLTATAGDYVVNVTVSNGCQTQTASAVPVGRLTVRPAIAVQTLSGGGEYCELTPTAQSLSLGSSQVGVEYILYRTTADGTRTEVERISGTDGGRIDFTSQTAAGTYSVEANFTTAPTCGPIAMNRDGGVITATPATELSGGLEVWDVPGTESPAMWELRAVNITPSTISGLTYKWYIGESINGQPVSTWTQINATSDPSVPTTQVEATDNESIRYRVIVFGPEGQCIRDLFLETTEAFELLPVELLYLNAERRGENVQVQWATAKEQNNTGFEVQVSTDGKVYRALGFVAAKNDGNSSTKLVYTYVDTERDKTGTRYYRLKQIDVDNTAEFFGPVTVDFGSRNKVTVAPNPFREEIRLTLETEMEGSAYIVMTNAVGMHILKRSITVEKGVNQKEIQLDSNLASGVYFITVRMGDLTKQFKLLKQ